MPTHIAEIVASLLLLTPEERTEVATALATQNSTVAGDFASLLLNAHYAVMQRDRMERMLRYTVTMTDEDADIDKRLKLA